MEKRKFFPVSIDLNGKECLIVGAGNIALRKCKKLLEYGAVVTVVAPEIKEEFYTLPITLKKERFNMDILPEYFLVIAATDDEKLNGSINSYCQKKNILINNITSKKDMNLRFSAILEKDEYQIAISADGNPKKSTFLKGIIEKFLNSYIK